MHKIKVYPELSLVVTVFSGSISIEEIKAANLEIARNPDFNKYFDGVSDFRSAQACFTEHELFEFRSSAIRSDFTRGVWCILTSSPLETAMSMIFANKMQKYIVKIFSTVEAASTYLQKDLQPMLNQSPSSAGRPLNSRI